MKFAPKVAVSLALVSMLWSPLCWQVCSAAGQPASGTSESSQDPRTEIERKIGDLEDAITQSVTDGRLTSEEADNFRSALAQIEEEEAVYMVASGKLGPVMQARLQTAFNRVQKRFYTTQHDRRIAIFDFGAAEEDINTWITDAKNDRRISADSEAALRGELKSIRDLQQALGRDGIISYGDALVISFRIDRLLDHLGRALTEPAVAAAPADEVANQASVALSNAKVSAEINELRKQYDALQTQMTAANNIKNNEQKAAQLLYLASQFELLKNKVDLAAAGKSIAVVPKERVQQIDFAIADAFVNGKLSPTEAHELRAELQGVIDELNADTAGEKTARISLELERVAGHTLRWRHQPHRTWAGFDAFQAAFDHRLQEAAAGNRITAEQLATYKTETDKIAKAEADRRAANAGKLTATDALELAMQMERLAVALHHDKKDRDVTVPDIDALQKELDKTIADGLVSGKLPIYTGRLTEYLQHITELRSNYEKSPGGLDARARLAIADSIAQTLSAVQQEIHREVSADQPVDLRLDKLGDTVSNAVAGGLITLERGQQYRAAVDTIYAELAKYRKSDAGLTAAESIAISHDISLLSAQLHEELRDSAIFAPFIAEYIVGLRVRIGNAVANGRLSIAQADSLVADLDKKSAALNLAAGGQGGLSHGEGLKLAYDIRRLQSKFDSMLHENPIAVADIAQQTILLDTRLANALAAGQLTVPEAQMYKNNLEKILASSALYRETDSGLTVAESIALALEIDQLGRAVDAGIRKDTANRNVDTREDELKKRISSLVTSGKLAQKDADALSYDLDRIEESEAAFRVSDEGLNYAEALTLTLDLDRLATKIDGISKGSVSTLQQPKSR